jgi:ATP-dependent DNA helicase HFM1/MER3
MLAGEKSFYKEINKAPEIKFPINVDVALQVHKISLLIQAELGNVTLPDGDQYRKQLQQHRVDKAIVFAQSNRLIRCIIDCQIHIGDSVSVRHALALSRSLAAHVWDNTASQLRQIDGLGEVAVRKLASASIKSVDSLINTEPSKIELVLGKNPPFGLGLLKKLESFPSLRVSVRETGREIIAGEGAKIRFKVEVGFLNDVVPQIFNKKPVYVCFLSETSDGRLVDFRRMSAKHLQNGEEIHLSVDLVRPTHQLCCFVMCDEVAGTSRYAELNLVGIPDTIYPAQQSLHGGPRHSALDPHRGKCYEDRWADEFDDGGIEDKDLLSLDIAGEQVEVVEDIDDLLEKGNKEQERHAPKRLNHDSENEDTDVVAFKEPTQLRNGRWTCQHECNDRGRKCKHKCCREGVAKPKRRPKLEGTLRGEDKSQRKLTDLSTIKSKTGQASKKPKGLSLHASIFGPETSLATSDPKNVSDEPPRKKAKPSNDQTEYGHQAPSDKPQLTEEKTFDGYSAVRKGVKNGGPEEFPTPKNSPPLPDFDFLLDDMTTLDCD